MLFHDPRNWLVLLGFVCQGYSWENPSISIFILVLFWALCLQIRHLKVALSQRLEAFILLISLIGFKLMSDVIESGYTNLMFLGGNVLLVYQIIHLIGSGDRRQQRTSIIVAIMHIGVGTQFIFDYKAIPIILVSLILIPKALHAVESEYFVSDTTLQRSRSSLLETIVLACLMIIFFLGFPRFRLLAETGNQLLGSQERGPLSSEVDMAGSSGGVAND